MSGAAYRRTCDCPTDAQGVGSHPPDCPAVAWMQDVQRENQEALSEMARLRVRAEVESRCLPMH